MYKFVKALNNYTYECCRKQFGHPETSDLSQIGGWVLNEEEIDTLPVDCIFQKYDIPEQYQNDIEMFKTDFWDGDLIFNAHTEQFEEFEPFESFGHI